MTTYANKTIIEMFEVKSGNYHATKELDPGTVPLISCGDTSNGLIGYFDIPAHRTYRRAITVAYNGSWPLLSKFHPYTFGAKDDVAVLVPRTALLDSTLFFVAAMLNRNTWRYSYGRKCFKEKLSNFSIAVPVLGDERIDESEITKLAPRGLEDFIPNREMQFRLPLAPITRWKDMGITRVFDIDRGDFHSIARLDPGSRMTVSRITEDNGVVGYFSAPKGAPLYKQGKITVSTVGGDAFVQLFDFIATDNVVICTPKIPLRLTTLFFVAFVLNRQRWRYSYGRQCYKTKFATTVISLPVKMDGELDEDTMGQFVVRAPYWSAVEATFGNGIVGQTA